MPILPEFNLEGRSAILATSGGDQSPELALALAEAGASVFTIARTRSLLESVFDTLSTIPAANSGGTAADVSTMSGLARAMGTFDQGRRQVDILVNDARSMFAKPFEQITYEEWNEVQSRNFGAAFLLTQEVSRRMMESQYGRIVNLVSVLAERGMINGSAFAASQAAILSLTRSLGVELGRHGIRVNALGAGWFTADDVPLEVQREELLVRYTPLRRKGRPQDIGPLLVYLCSEACDYSTGQPVYVDGGLNAHP